MIKSRRLTVCRGFGLQVHECENLGFALITCTCVADTFVHLAGRTVPQTGDNRVYLRLSRMAGNCVRFHRNV